MFCPQCGLESSDEFNFCPKCGTNIGVIRSGILNAHLENTLDQDATNLRTSSSISKMTQEDADEPINLSCSPTSNGTEDQTRVFNQRDEANSSNEAEKDQQLWDGMLGRLCRFAPCLVFWNPIDFVLKNYLIGALWYGLLCLLIFYIGYRIGDSLVKPICVNKMMSYNKKIGFLWVLLFFEFISYLFLFSIAWVYAENTRIR